MVGVRATRTPTTPTQPQIATLMRIPRSHTQLASLLPLPLPLASQRRTPRRRPGGAFLSHTSRRLPAIVRERLVGFGHAVRVFLLLHTVALTLRRRDHFGGQLLGHRLLVALARVLDQPAHGERRAALGTHFDGHLVGGAADAAALHLDHRLEVGQRLLEHVHARLRRAALDEVHRRVENALAGGLLALVHQDVDELRHRLAVVARVREDRALDALLAAAHLAPPFGFLVPYLERLLLRPLTPEASSLPRTM